MSWQTIRLGFYIVSAVLLLTVLGTSLVPLNMPVMPHAENRVATALDGIAVRENRWIMATTSCSDEAFSSLAQRRIDKLAELARGLVADHVAGRVDKVRLAEVVHLVENERAYFVNEYRIQCAGAR